MSALRCEGVEKRYGGAVALAGVTFEVAEGETFALLGPNGAGKTTLVRLALDLLRPDAGTIEVTGLPPGPAALDRLTYLPEERGLYRGVSVEELLVYLGCLKGLVRSDARARARRWLERVELGHVARRTVETLSKGMAQKVQIVAALMPEPRLAILDEPFSGLDPLNAALVAELLVERTKAGGATLLATHQMDRAERLASRVALLHRGRILHVGPPAELRGTATSLEDAFVARVRSAEAAS